MQQININELKQHPRNNEFFDDMSGEKWKEFLDSVKTRGVIEPVVITPDKTIVSGHQRVRACKELGIISVMCDVHTYDNEDQILQDLLETNIRQRGDVGGSAKKVGKRIKELERLYGIKHGGNRLNQDKKASPNNLDLISKTQEDLMKELNMSKETLRNYKVLADMIPELEDLVDTGIVTKTTALAMMKQLSEEEQKELIESIDTSKKFSKKDMETYVNEINSLKKTNREQLETIQKQKEELNNKPTTIEVEKVVEKYVDSPETLAKIDKLEKQVKEVSNYDEVKKDLELYKQDNKNLQEQFQTKVSELQDLRKQIQKMKDESPSEQYVKKLKDSSLLFCSKVATFIEQVGGYVWLTDVINEIPEFEREGYIRSIHAIKSWADTMEYNINNTTKEIK